MTKTILLADDSVTIRKVVELTFMDESFDLVSVASGDQALERFDASVDLVIADVHMPGADGYQVCEEVKKRSSKTPVLLLVGTFETFDESKASDAGADGHLKKPFDSQDLLGRVHELLARSEAGVADSEAVAESTANVFRQEVEEPVFPAAAQGEESTDPEPDAEASDSAESADSIAAGIAAGAVSVTTSESPDQDQAVTANLDLSEESIDRIARRVVELLSEDALREVAWEVIPDLAEVVIKERLQELESQVE